MGADPTLISAQPPPQKTVARRNTPADFDEDTAVTPQSALPMAAAIADADKTTPAHVSKGERVFNWVAYGGFAGAVTFLLSLPMGYWARYSKAGQKTIKWAAHKIEPMGFSEHSAEDIVMTTALMQGGNIALLPIKMMESKKQALVDKLNEKLGDSCDDASVQAGVKQSWGSLLKSRAVAWCAVYFSLRGTAQMAGKEKFNDFEHAFSRDLICKPLGKPTHINGAETTLYRYGRIAAIDLFASAAAAGLLFLGSRIFGNKEKAQATIEMPAAAETETMPTAVSGDAPVAVAAVEPAPAKPKHSGRFVPAESFVQKQAMQSENSPVLAH